MARDTTTGAVLEQMVLPALASGGYSIEKQVPIGSRPGGRAHRVDVIASQAQRQILVSLKWQQVSGTAEQKVPFEVICLAEALRREGSFFSKAYLVLGGSGWTLRDFYTSGGLDSHLTYSSLIDVVSLEDFIAQANQARL